ncbi:MAG: hypothetical protein GX036_05670 [Firmicutes bacterium]|nr:hypothetical protein [Bacillota bacterium]
MKRVKKGALLKGLLLAGGLLLFNPGVAGAAWQPGNLTWKNKYQEEEGFFTRAAYSFGYRTRDLRWNWRLVYNEPSADDRLSFLRTEARKRAGGNWWYGGWGRFATQPACNYLGARLFLENTSRRGWSGRLWGEGEERMIRARPHLSSRLDEYSYREAGARIRLRWAGFSWLGELKGREKEYRRLVKNSWRKLQLETGGEHRWGGNFFSLRYRESTGVYPENAWKNEWGNYWNFRWEWKINDRTHLVTRGSRLFREWGEGKQREEWELTGILECPRSPEMTVGWMLAYRKAVRRDYWEYDPDDEEEEREEPGFRAGLRWQRVLPGCRVRIELFRHWQAEQVREGILLVLRGGEGKWRWQVGIAPWGGFNSSAEKGYWVETRYYF